MLEPDPIEELEETGPRIVAPPCQRAEVLEILQALEVLVQHHRFGM
jgi:hypothetical protein